MRPPVVGGSPKNWFRGVVHERNAQPSAIAHVGSSIFFSHSFFLTSSKFTSMNLS